MTSRCAKPILALLLVLALGLGFAARAIAAPAAGLNWEVHGTGEGGVSTQTTLLGVVVVTGASSTGPAMPQHVGNATYRVDLGPAEPFAGNGAGGFCYMVRGTGHIDAADGSTINFNTVGTLCNEGTVNSTFHYNGTYRITGGDGRFTTGVVGGGGSLTVTFGSPNFFKIDGTITGI